MGATILHKTALPEQPSGANLRLLAGSVLSAEMGQAHRSVNHRLT